MLSTGTLAAMQWPVVDVSGPVISCWITELAVKGYADLCQLDGAHQVALLLEHSGLK